MVPAVMLATACVSLPVAGCATQPASALASAVVATGEAAAGHPAPDQAARAPGPRLLAAAEATRLVRAFIGPPGATRVTRPPAVARRALAAPAVSIGSATLVDHVAYWIAPGKPAAVLSWEAARRARQFTAGASGTGSAPPVWGEEFSLPPTAVLTARDLDVTVTSAGGDQTAIRVDGQVAWQPPRPASEAVPATARLVTLAEVPVLNQPSIPSPVTVSKLAAVEKIAALVDGLPLATTGREPCPMPVGNELRLTFRARAAGPPLAVAEGPAVCSTVQFSVNGKQQPALAMTGSFIADVLAAAGLHWGGLG
jgi:hypothetical protein